MEGLLLLITKHGPFALVGLLAAFVLWQIAGRGPRQRRAYRRGQRRLQRGQWREALLQVDKIHALGRLSKAWQGPVDRLAGECRRQAGAAALADKQYEQSLEHLLQASRLLQLKEDDARDYVRNAMLGELRRLFAAGQSAAAQDLIGRSARLHSCPEADFWRALLHLREGQSERGRAVLEGLKGSGLIDPLLYLGMLQLRAGQPSEALRQLSTAHRLDPRGALVNALLGQAMIAAGSDPGLAVRALQRGLEALAQWDRQPERVWTHGLPESSCVRRLALQHAYTCPLVGSDPRVLARQARLALAQAHARLGQHAEAAKLGRQLLGETAPTLPVLLMLGLALARLEQYDEAFKHLRAAYDLEETKQATTAGFLALCGALGKPVRAEDKVSNIVWAIGLLRPFPPASHPELAAIHARVLAEARAAGLIPAVADVRRAAEAQAAVSAADPLAAGVVDDLAEHGLVEVSLEHACLYGRAVQTHGVRGRHDLDLLARLFQQAGEARVYFESRGWDIDDLECLFLMRWSESRSDSCVPAALGDGRAQPLLLARSLRLEEAGQIKEALATAAALARLRPASAAALDRLACLHHRRGDAEQALAVLADWQARHPHDPRPHLRRAALEQQRGNRLARTLAIRQALELARGPARARAAWLGARLELASPGAPPPFDLLGECLRDQPDHADALACLAALRWQAGDRPGLAALSPAMKEAQGPASFHYLAAVCHLEAGQRDAALAAARLAAREGALIQEARFLMAWSHLAGGDGEGATPHLKMAAADPECASAPAARAWLGRLAFQSGGYEEAFHWWQQLEPPRRAAWGLEPALQAAVFLAGLAAYRQERFEDAATRFREAGRLGCRDRRIGQLMQLAFFKGGQRLLQANGTDPHDAASRAAALLEKCLQVGCKDPQAACLQALALRRLGRSREAREVLARIAEPAAADLLLRGLLAWQDRQLAEAEEDFARACQLEPASPAASFNLLMARLSLGRRLEAGAVLARMHGPTAHLRQLRPLLGQDDFSLLGHPELSQLGPAEEARLIGLLRDLGNLDTAAQLLEALRQARPESAPLREAQFETALLTARQHLLRCEWSEATQTLIPWARPRLALRTPLTALHNLLGCAACLSQDFDHALQHFASAARLDGHDARLRQNQALALEWGGKFSQAEESWLRFVDDLGRAGQTAAAPASTDRLMIDVLLRLAGIHADRLNQAAALRLVEMAHRLQPENTTVLDRLFQLYRQLDRGDLARRTLQRLQQLMPDDPNLDLYELELAPLRRADELERWIHQLETVLQRHPRDRRLLDRSSTLLSAFVNAARDLARQSGDQFARAIRQVRSLRHDEVNWRAVHKVMRDLRTEFTLLRHAVGRALVLDAHPGHLGQIRELVETLDRKIEETRRWQGES